MSQFIDALTSNPDVWSKTVLFLNFDEEGGFFDHMVPPTPPAAAEQGASTVPTINEIFPGGGGHPAGPYGLGVRVPLLVISPWSTGGWVSSQVFDHTSLIKFIETRFAPEHPDVIEPNITPWRRAVVGDLTSAFDFDHPEGRPMVALPDTDAFKPQELVGHPDDVPVVPAEQRLPRQERGVRPARAVPYVLHVEGTVNEADGSLRLDFSNVGEATAVFQVRSGNPAHAPRVYTVEAGKYVSGTWSIRAIGADDYDLMVYGPNGFFRAFKGGLSSASARLDVQAAYDRNDSHVILTIVNRGVGRQAFSIMDRYTGKTTTDVVGAHDAVTRKWPVARFSGWHDFIVSAEHDAGFQREVAGHLESGRDSISDPLMGGLV